MQPPHISIQDASKSTSDSKETEGRNSDVVSIVSVKQALFENVQCVREKTDILFTDYETLDSEQQNSKLSELHELLDTQKIIVDNLLSNHLSLNALFNESRSNDNSLLDNNNNILLNIADDGLCFFRAKLVDATGDKDYADKSKKSEEDVVREIKVRYLSEIKQSISKALGIIRPEMLKNRSDDEIIEILTNNLNVLYSGAGMAHTFKNIMLENNILDSNICQENEVSAFDYLANAIFTTLKESMGNDNIVLRADSPHYDVKVGS